MKKSLKHNKKIRKHKSRRARYSRKRGGMFSRLATGVARKLEPRIQKKAEEWGVDIIEAKAKTTDAYKNYENAVNSTGKDLSYKITNVYNENIKPTNSSNIPQTLPNFKNITPSGFYFKSINHPLSNI